VVGTLLDAKPDVIWSKPPWPPPHMHIEFECGSDDIRPFPWPSFTTIVPELAIWKCCTLPRKPPWPPPAHQYFRTVHAETVESWKHKTVITEWSLHVLIQEGRKQQCGGTFGLVWHKDRLMVPKWLADIVMTFLVFYGETITVLLCCAITTVLLLLELL